MLRISGPCLLVSALSLPCSPALAQPTPGASDPRLGRIEGVVSDPGGDPTAGASVLLVELRRRAATAADGSFAFDEVPQGTYLLEVASPRKGHAVATVRVAPGETVRAEVTMDLSVHHEDIVVSASAEPRSASEVSRPVTVLDGSDLQARAQPTLGETLAREPGVSATSYAPGTSRPVIRGLGADRIRILEDGVGVGDVSNVSEDHAVSTDPMGAERIEIVRGPATLLYGSNAVGGVVNVLDGRIPDHVPDRLVTGALDLRYGTAAEERTGGVSLDGGAGSFAWHAAGVRRETDDTDTPLGPLVDSDVETASGTLGAAWIGDKAQVGLAWGRFETDYGIPNPAEPIRIDLTQDRWDLQAEWNAPLGFLRGLRLRAGSSDYEHVEIEGTGNPGTRFLADGWEARLEAPHADLGPVKGSFGLQASARDLEAIGDEAFVPPTATDALAVFAFEEVSRGPWTFELGARYESQDASAAPAAALPDRSFSALSGSGGVVWKPSTGWSVGAVLSRTTRFPTTEELYANGPHLATFQFQVGDPGLEEERGLGIDLSLRRPATSGRVSGELNVFLDRFDRFVFLAPTGNVVDVDGEPLPELRYLQADAELRGAELHVDVDLLHVEPHHLQLEARADYVRGEERPAGAPLPRIPPLRTALALHYQGERLWGRVEGIRVEEQDRVASFETPTDGYTVLQASAGCRWIRARLVHDVVLRGANLTDRVARNHLSALKELVPLAGRDVSLAYRLTF